MLRCSLGAICTHRHTYIHSVCVCVHIAPRLHSGEEEKARRNQKKKKELKRERHMAAKCFFGGRERDRVVSVWVGGGKNAWKEKTAQAREMH